MEKIAAILSDCNEGERKRVLAWLAHWEGQRTSDEAHTGWMKPETTPRIVANMPGYPG